MSLRFLLLLFLCASWPAKTASLKVIGLGPGRTGTESLKAALIELGYGPSYHMREVLLEVQGISTEGHTAKWKALAEGNYIDLGDMLKEFSSGTDFPLSAFPAEMFEAFPDAKFILTVRPVDRWYNSIQTSICWFHSPTNYAFKVLAVLPFLPFSRIKGQGEMMDSIVRYKMSTHEEGIETWGEFCNPDNRDKAIAYFERNKAFVKDLIPEEQLLIFEAGKNSYSDLANFLGVPTPSSDYPNINSSREFGRRILTFKLAAIAVVIAVMFLIGFSVLLLARLLKKKDSGVTDRKKEM